MAEYTPRHAVPSESGGSGAGATGAPRQQDPNQRRRLAVAAVAGVVGLAAIFGITKAVHHDDDSTGSAASSGTSAAGSSTASGGSSDAASASSTGSGSGSAAAGASGNGSAAASSSAAACSDAATIDVDPAWAASMQQAVTAYTASLGKDCSPVALTTVSDAQVTKNGLGSAQGWIPEDASVASGKSPTVVGSSPLVVVTQQQVKDALGSKTLTGQTLANLVSGQTDWKTLTGKDWGQARLVLPNPATTVSGAAGFGSLVSLVAGNGTASSNATTTAAAIQKSMIQVSQVQYHVAQTVSDAPSVLQHLAAVSTDNPTGGATGPRIGVTTEAALLAAKPASGTLAATQLGDGSTGVQLAVANPSKNSAVSDFTTWLSGDDGKKALAAGGVTTSSTSPDSSLLQSVGLSASSATVQANTASTIASSRKLYQGLSVRMALTNVLDASGSMGQTVGGVRKIDVVTQSAAATWDKWPAGSAVALITFNSVGGTPQINTVVPWTVVGSAGSAAKLQQYASHLTSIPATGGTPLYQAIWAGYTYALQHYSAGKSNQVFIITDGSDQDARENITLQQLVANLKKADPTRPIKMRYLAVGANADIKTLSYLASASGGLAAKANSVAELPQVMSGMLAAG